MEADNEKPEDGMSKYHRENIEKATKKEAFYKEIVHCLQTEERFVNYFKGFTTESVETFIKTYANQRSIGTSMEKCLNNLPFQKEHDGIRLLNVLCIQYKLIKFKRF